MKKEQFLHVESFTGVYVLYTGLYKKRKYNLQLMIPNFVCIYLSLSPSKLLSYC